jgi:hypothetical protein
VFIQALTAASAAARTQYVRKTDSCAAIRWLRRSKLLLRNLCHDNMAGLKQTGQA